MRDLKASYENTKSQLQMNCPELRRDYSRKIATASLKMIF